ncbi:MAG: RNA polymerase sigma factor RpoE [Gammaproteobacteria bacterium]|nr:RNA polymerase sigma factor RpoE [Gammaproteobacteria bacterium]MDE0366205.1 RNA polymerase sigma factor RpoE [Gammaproteobacteria bacterium]
MAKDNDRELVRRFKGGDQAAFELLFTRYQHKVLGLIGRHLNDPDEVQDVAQEAFVRAFRALPRFRGESAFYTWLYRIALNTTRNHVAARNRRPPPTDIDVADARLMDGVDTLRDDEDPLAALSRDELSSEIRQAIGALPDDQRSAVILREMDGLSYDQIAEVMHCPVGTVRSRIFRAREAIDKRIRPLLE